MNPFRPHDPSRIINPLPVDSEVAAHMDKIVFWENEIVCEREECITDHVKWHADIFLMTVEQVLYIRHEHLRDHHPRARLR